MLRRGIRELFPHRHRQEYRYDPTFEPECRPFARQMLQGAYNYQKQNPPKYEARKGLVRGTLFQGLDLPFMGMINQKDLPSTPLAELQTMAFVLQELALYLDTHPNDQGMVMLFEDYNRKKEKLCKEYEKEYG